MKKILMFTFFLISFIHTFSQKKFTYREKGLTDFIVIKVDSLSQSELYYKTIDWIKNNYRKPEEVIKAKYENEKICFAGIEKNAFSISGAYYDGRYSVEVYFNKGKVIFNPISLDQRVQLNWIPIIIDHNSWLFNKKGKIYKPMQTYPDNIELLFNNLVSSLELYLLKETGKIKDSSDDW